MSWHCRVRTSKGCFPTSRDCSYYTTSTLTICHPIPAMLPNFNWFGPPRVGPLYHSWGIIGEPRRQCRKGRHYLAITLPIPFTIHGCISNYIWRCSHLLHVLDIEASAKNWPQTVFGMKKIGTLHCHLAVFINMFQKGNGREIHAPILISQTSRTWLISSPIAICWGHITCTFCKVLGQNSGLLIYIHLLIATCPRSKCPTNLKASVLMHYHT